MAEAGLQRSVLEGRFWRRDMRPARLGDRITRYRDPAHAMEAIPPFPAYVRAMPTLGDAPRGRGPAPCFGDVHGPRPGGVKRVVSIGLESGTSLYGLGEAVGPLLRTGRRARGWNTDCYGYNMRTRAVYQSQPWVLGVRADGSAFGVIIETTHEFECDLRRGIVFACAGLSPGVVMIERESVWDVLASLAELTGRMPMPPLWALGYQQCRWSYEPDSRVREVAGEFRARRMPCDVMWMDIDSMDGFRCFTFDPVKFADPARLNADLHGMGFRSVWMIDPGIKVDPGYGVYESGRAGGHFVAHASGGEYHGRVWPGECAFPDFTRERTRSWWGDLYRDFMGKGVDGVWNDMNEPAIFDGPGKSMRANGRHDADEELGGAGEHARYHNVYGMLMARATREGIARVNPGKRPFVLTRSNFLGGHRYAATWTGDNTSTWEHLRASIPMILNLGLSGQAFSGPDIGGFDGNATPELFARWMGIGALLPFARGHTIKGSRAHEPWSFGAECERVCRLALERRYRLMPYLYTLFWECSRRGVPIARPAFFADPRDTLLRGVDHAFLLGGDVLVVADVNPPGRVRDAASARAGKPGGVLNAWREFDVIGERCDDLPRLYIRPGAIVPTGPAVQHTGELVGDVHGTASAGRTLMVAPDEEGLARGVAYDDAGDGYGYEQGEYAVTEYAWRSGAISARAVDGTMTMPALGSETVRIV